MPMICYQPKEFAASSLEVIDEANEIIDRMAADGFILTVRQLYYQFVAKALIPNTMRSYKRLASIISDARLAGLVDWDAIEDRTRKLDKRNHWGSPQQILDVIAVQYREEKWATQPCRVEVWIEKDALTGIIEPACKALDIDFFACRGYASQSELWKAGQRLGGYAVSSRPDEDGETRLIGQDVVILHFGDHDPSGIDMTRDNDDRLNLFSGGLVEVKRIALNMDQVEQYNPPPNPTKMKDSRADGYVDEFGDSSWELDALDPKVIDRLIRDEVMALRDENAWAEAEEREAEQKAALADVASRWDDVKRFLADEYLD